VPIFFDLQTREIEFGNRAHVKSLANDVVVFADGGRFGVSSDGNEFKYLISSLADGINSADISAEGNRFTFRWQGESTETPPQLDGFYIEDITDLGTQ
jgi:hypothetical protein